MKKIKILGLIAAGIFSSVPVQEEKMIRTLSGGNHLWSGTGNC
jgi:hypothetical protein